MVKLNLELDPSFYKKEMRCGYLIKSEMKKIWAVELDLLNEFILVCEKYKLTYFIMGGTLLGAVRHKGFIPWDDDIDVIMPRKDYDKLLEIGPYVFKEPYFFQCTFTEKNFWRTHIQIRNSMTTGFIEEDRKGNSNKGIFIDVFVLDSVPDTLKERNKHRDELLKTMKLVKIHKYWDEGHPNKFSILTKFKKFILNCLIKVFTYRKTFKKYNLTCKKFEGYTSNTVAHTTLSYSNGNEKVVWKAIDFSEIIQLPFENLIVNAPAGFDEILKKQYGKDYNIIPKIHPDTSHGSVNFDPDHSFIEYLKKGGTR